MSSFSVEISCRWNIARYERATKLSPVFHQSLTLRAQTCTVVCSVVVVRGFTVQQAKLSRFLVVSAVVAESVILCPRAKTAACGTVRRYDADFAFALGLIRVNPPGSI